jgi:hypothetical protein
MEPELEARKLVEALFSGEVHTGLGRIVALYFRSSTSYQIH